jgi:hypothetical protein
LNRVEAEHQMSEQGAETSARDLHQHVENSLAPVELAPDHHHQADRWVEMGAGDRRKNGDDHHEDGACRERIAEERERDVSA